MAKGRGRSNSKSKSKGKRKAVESPSQSPRIDRQPGSDDPPGPPPPSQVRQRKKKKRQSSNSPDQTKVHGAHGPGLAAFAALVSKHEGQKSARQETNTGLTKRKSGSGLKAKEKASTADGDAFRVGKIVFLTTGIMASKIDPASAVPAPKYATQTKVDVSHSALVGLIQCGLCIVREEGFVFNKSDIYDTINDELEKQFPFLFSHFSSESYRNALDDYEAEKLSPWLVCMKRSGHQPGVLVYSTDSELPNGMDLYTASHIKNRASYTELSLFLVTRRPISLEEVLRWIKESNPDLERYREGLVSTQADADDSENESSSVDGSNVFTGIGVAGPGPSTSSSYTLRSKYSKRSITSVLERDDIISISSDNDSDYHHDSPTPAGPSVCTPSRPEVPSQLQATTPPVVEDEQMVVQMEDFFNSSMVFGPDADWANRSDGL